MTISKTRAASAAVLVFAVAAGLAALPGGGAGPARADETGTWQDLVLLYHSDVKGKIEPCG
jgi:hypothetical protein